MAISGFRGKGGTEGMSHAAPAPPVSAPGNLTAFIDQGSKFEGKLSFKDTVRIDGGFVGEISSENTLIVGESGEIEASIQSCTVVISGVVTGNVSATQQVVMHKSARVDGDVETPSIIIEEGAVFNGRLMMKSDGQGRGPLKAIKGGSPPPSGGASNAPDGQQKS